MRSTIKKIEMSIMIHKKLDRRVIEKFQEKLTKTMKKEKCARQPPEKHAPPPTKEAEQLISI